MIDETTNFEAAAIEAVKIVESYKINPSIKAFVENEALEKMIADGSALGLLYTKQALLALINFNESAKERFNTYVIAGYVGAFMAAMEQTNK